MKKIAFSALVALTICCQAAAQLKSSSRGAEKNWWLPRHEKTVQAIKSGSGEYDLVFVGDSITDFWSNGRSGGAKVAKKHFSKWTLLNLGVMGDRIENMLWRLENGEGTGFKAKVFMVLAGTNNIGKRASGESVAAGTEQLVRWLRTNHPSSRIVLVAIFPRDDKKQGKDAKARIEKANELTAKLADGDAVIRLDISDKFLDAEGNLRSELFKDRLHPNAAGYEIWAEAALPLFEQLIAKSQTPPPPPPAEPVLKIEKTVSTADDIANFESGGQLETDPAEVEVEAPKDMKLILCMGQSNMAGRANMTDEDKQTLEGAYKLNKNGKWVAAKSPYHFDKKSAAVGPVDDFVRMYLKDHPGETVGVVPCAVGGSPFSSWEPPPKGPRRGVNWAEAVRRAKIAQGNGRFIAILWHQGETDAAKAKDNTSLNDAYPKKFTKMIKTLREELGEGDIPVVAGEIGYWPRPDGDHAARINPGINAIPAMLEASAVASADGLTNQDRHHFNRASQRTLAERYYEAFKKIEKR